MNIKLVFNYTLVGWMSIANAAEIGDKISNSYQTKVVGNIAVSIYPVDTPSHYAVNIYAISTKHNIHPKNITEKWTPPVSIVDKKLWTITSNQLPFTLNDCLLNNFDPCYKNISFCYRPCFGNMDPDILAIDDKNKRVYLNYASIMVGTGGGPSLLFIADINKKEIKFLKIINIWEKGSVSPSGRYFLVHGFSIISIYNTKTKSWFEINKSENEYTASERNIRHHLNIINWLSDTQFVYIDNARYFIRSSEPMPFVSAKEFTYDISTKTKLNEKVLTEKEYEEIMKVAQNK